MKFLLKLFGLVVIDFILIWIWVYKMDPDPSVSIGIIFLVPLVFGINIVIAGILLVIKIKEYSKLFLINSVIMSILMVYLFGKGIERHQIERLERWEFTIADSTFQINKWKKENAFSMSYRTDHGSSWEFIHGNCEIKDGELLLSTDSTKYKIKDNYLIGFRNMIDSIKLIKIDK